MKKITLDRYILDMLLYTPTRWLMGILKGNNKVKHATVRLESKYTCKLYRFPKKGVR